MKLTIQQKNPGIADGHYQITAKGCIAASLHWADEAGALPDWQSFAYVPMEPNGVGVFRFAGGRAIPREATHVLARAVSSDFTSYEEILEPIPCPPAAEAGEEKQRFLVMTDLHLSAKPWQVRKALAMGKDYDGVLITGDITNDGTQDQLEAFWGIVEELLPGIPVFVAAGNHDYPKNPLPFVVQGIPEYPYLQEALLYRAENMGIPILRHESGAYAARIGDTEIIGLNAATHWRRFAFPEGAQLQWLLEHLLYNSAKRHIILCHAPLLRHQPYPSKDGQTYLSRDSILQRIVDVERTEVIFLSGHTHISMNCLPGCVELAERNHLYINAGSIRPTTLKPDEPLQPQEWTEGNVVELRLGSTGNTVTGISLKKGQKMARAYYETQKYMGTCGKNLQWSFRDGCLFITGDGELDLTDGEAAPYDPDRDPSVSLYMEREKFLSPVNRPWQAFADQITRISIGDGCRSIGRESFAFHKNLTQVRIPASVQEIGWQAFLGCEKLEAVQIPWGVREIQWETFAGCISLKSAVIPQTVTAIRANAFAACINLEDLVLTGNQVQLEGNPFGGCGKILK